MGRRELFGWLLLLAGLNSSIRVAVFAEKHPLWMQLVAFLVSSFIVILGVNEIKKSWKK